MSEHDLYPLHVFRFQVDFLQDSLGKEGEHAPVTLCSGAFSECTGLEATMEPRVIKEGGRNYGAAQRAGGVTFATVVLKRGMTTTRDLWRWWELVNGTGAYAYRLSAEVKMFGPNPDARVDELGEPVLTWRLSRALPVKFRAADLNARSTEIGIEELHLAHEGLSLTAPGQ